MNLSYTGVMTETSRKTACAYYRTSSKTNVSKEGAKPEDMKDSRARQEEAVRGYAEANDIEIVKEYYDPGISGTDFVTDRPGFSDMLEYMLGNGARIVLVENVTRFARDVVVQITGHKILTDSQIELIPVDAPDYFLEESPTADLVREIFAVISKFEKASLVQKLRGARDRKRKLTGHCEGPKPPAPAHILEAKKLHASHLSLREISACMASMGMLQYKSLQPYGPTSIKLMITGKYDKTLT